MTARLIGLCIVAAGLAAGWFIILDPLQQAQIHGTPVHISMKAFVFAPLAIVSGTFLTLGGNSVAPIFLGAPRGASQKVLAIVIMIIAFSATGVAWWLFKAHLAALGYGH